MYKTRIIIGMLDIAKTYKSLLFHGLFFLLLVGGIHTVAMVYDLYFIMSWFDMFMHGLGGVAFGYVMYAAVIRFFPRYSYKEYTFWLIWLLALGIIVVGWEFFEYILSLLNLHGWTLGYDSVNDIFCGLLGGIVACLWGNQFCMYYNNSNTH